MDFFLYHNCITSCIHARVGQSARDEICSFALDIMATSRLRQLNILWNSKTRGAPVTELTGHLTVPSSIAA
jgi:hypothetical protein